MTGVLGGLPASMMDTDAELVKAIVQAYEAIITRIDGANDLRGQQGQNWHLNLGLPNPDNMPQEPLAVWLHLANARPNPQSPFNADLYDSTWWIYVAQRKQDNDDVGFDPIQGLLAVGAIETRLRSTLNDLALDDAAEIQTDFSIDHDILRPKEQGEYDLWMLQMTASLGLLNCV